MAQYYVKNGGIDSKTGLSDADAWGTIGKVNSINFDDNDIISFKRGSTFADEILTLDSTSAGRSGITIQDYGYGSPYTSRLRYGSGLQKDCPCENLCASGIPHIHRPVSNHRLQMNLHLSSP